MIDDILFGLIAECVYDVRLELIALIQEGSVPMPDTSLYTIDLNDAAWPKRTTSKKKSYKEYIDFEEKSFYKHATVTKHASWYELWGYVSSSETLTAALARDELPADLSARWAEISMSLFVEYLVDRFLYVHGIESEPARELLESLFEPLERGLLSEDLPANVIVPLLLAPFELVEAISFGIDIDVELIKIPPALHVARCRSLGYDWSLIHPDMAAAATHALVIRGHTVQRESLHRLWGMATDVDLTEADRFVSAFHVETGMATGYSHVILEPLGWALSYETDLPVIVDGPRLKAYPSALENGAWNRRRSPVDGQALNRIVVTFEGLASASGSLEVASRRYSQALHRSSEDDAIIDYCISLEALLGDSTGQEIGHKIATRAAALLATSDSDPLIPDAVFRAIKKIYTHRSKLVHGQRVAARDRTFRYSDTEYSTRWLADWFARRLVSEAIRRPSARDASHIDGMLLERLAWPEPASPEDSR